MDVLNRLLRILLRSLPMYLDEARPWTRRGDEALEQALTDLVADQRELAGRVVQEILDLGGAPATGGFPTPFTAANDLSIEYLLVRLVECQKDYIAEIRQCVDDLATAPRLRNLALEILGNAKGHLEKLEALARPAQVGRIVNPSGTAGLQTQPT
jgi:hypothetical protein